VAQVRQKLAAIQKGFNARNPWFVGSNGTRDNLRALAFWRERTGEDYLRPLCRAVTDFRWNRQGDLI